MRFKDIINEEDNANLNYDVTDDRGNTMHLDDTRKPRLTLRHINKLRQMREAKKLDMKNRKDTWKKMYGAPEEAPDDLGF